jgi:hypothetical protein
MANNHQFASCFNASCDKIEKRPINQIVDGVKFPYSCWQHPLPSNWIGAAGVICQEDWAGEFCSHLCKSQHMLDLWLQRVGA